MNNQNEVLAAFSAAAQALVAIAGFVLSYAVWKMTKRITESDQARKIADAENAINLFALSSEENLNLVESLHRIGQQDEPYQKRRMRWLSFLCLNSMENVYLSTKAKAFDEKAGNRILEQILHPLLKDPELFNLTQTRGYHPEFAEYCRRHHRS